MVAGVKVYTVNGATAGSSSSLPDWLTRKRTAAKGKGKRAIREHYEGTIELIQGFEFPEASIKIKTTRDGHHVIGTGVYKPQMRVWDLDQLTLKFERHSDAENVDFVILSDDWTKSIHLQNDRTIELHTQGGFHYRTRVPRFGRSIGYHFPSCDAYVTAAGNEVYRLNLEQGRFMNPLVLTSESDDIVGVNVVDINPAHQLLAFGIDGDGSTQFWDPRSRSSVGTLRLPRSIVSSSSSDGDLSVTAISSRPDGLSYAIGTSTGHTLLYDIRSSRHFAMKDQGYGLPVKKVSWVGGGSKMAGDELVITADKKVIKIWDRNTPDANFASITPANDLNDLHHIPGTGLIMSANEGIQMATYYIPALGPAPRWASFLENITEEMEDQTTRSVYEDFKFIERTELAKLGLDHLIGTPALKPYMHGYFVSLKLYDAARVIANPYAYQEHRERAIKEKMDKLAESRIRTKKDAGPGVKVNKALAERILKEEEKARKREERKKARKAAEGGDEMDVEEGDAEDEQEAAPASVLSDPRFAAVFENPAFAIDENSREYAMLNPGAAGLRTKERAKTAVEEEEEESDRVSSDGLGESETEEEDSDSDSSGDDEIKKAAGVRQRAYESQPVKVSNGRVPRVNLVPMNAQSSRNAGNLDKNATFGQRRSMGSSFSKPSRSSHGAKARHTADGGMEMSWTPTSATGPANDDDMLVPNAPGRPQKNKNRRKPGVESFGAGMEKGGRDEMDIGESERKGRSKRRTGMRSGSRNMFRNL